MSRLLITHPLPSSVCGRASSHGIELDVHDSDTPMPRAQLAERLGDKQALVCTVNDRIDAELLAVAPQLRIAANCAVGFDNIDVAAATSAGVQVTNTPGVLTDATADLAFALMLATARRIPEADRYLRAGEYRHWKLRQEQLGLDVFSQTLGIFGLGRIGRAVAYRARRGFDMAVLATSRTRLPAAEEAALGIEAVGFEELLSRSDFISIHAPMTEATRHVFDATAFERMRSSSILINTARGPLIDEAALVRALDAGEIWGAGLDVFEAEPDVDVGLLRNHDRVVLLPHIGSATEHTRRRMAEIAVDNAVAVLTGHPAPNPVSL